MPETASASGVAPRFALRGARELIDDIDLLLDHLGRVLVRASGFRPED